MEMTWTAAAVAAACVMMAMSVPFLRRMVIKAHDYACGSHGAHRNTHLPRGSMGLPCLGESLTLKSQRHKFWTSRQQMYGDVFKTHLFGHPSIVVAGPEAARFVMVDKASCFRQRGLPMIERLLGSSFFGYQPEKAHADFRKILHGPFLPEALERSIPVVEAIAIDILKHWDGKTVNTLEEAKKYVFKVAMEFVIGATPLHEKEELTRACEQLIRGVSSIPIKVPGTNYYKALKESRKKAIALVDKIMSFRRLQDGNTGSLYNSNSNKGADVLGLMMTLEDENGNKLSDEEIYDNVLTFLYAAYDSSAAALCWLIKVLTEQRDLLSQVQVQPKLFSFTPFGSGSHVCMGRELVHLQLLVFIHHLVLKYNWEPHGEEDGSEFMPVHVPKGGFPIHVKRRGRKQSIESRWREAAECKADSY